SHAYPLSLHDALPISRAIRSRGVPRRACPALLRGTRRARAPASVTQFAPGAAQRQRRVVAAEELGAVVEQRVARVDLDAAQRERSEEHTSELQSPYDL